MVYEVFKVVMRERGETEALARASLAHRLPMADSLILATALLHDATLWTMDEHFKGLPQVRYFSSQS